MEQGLEYRQQLLQGYKQMISPLLGYLPWLEANQGYFKRHPVQIRSGRNDKGEPVEPGSTGRYFLSGAFKNEGNYRVLG